MPRTATPGAMSTASTPSMRRSLGDGGGGPSISDWSRHRETIRRLYIDEKRKLKEVMDIMATEHNLVASPKMYKVRMKQWGYSKNIRTVSEDVRSLMDSVNQTDRSVVLATGRVVDSQRLALHLRRKKQGLVRATLPPLPHPPSIRPPDIFHISEAVLAHTRGYMYGQTIDVEFVSGRTAHPETKQVTDSMHMLRGLLRADKLDEAVVFLRKVPDQIRALLRHEPPQILNRIFTMVVHLLSVPGQQERVGRIVKALVNYAAAAAAEPNLGWSDRHPVRRVLQGLASLDDQDTLALHDLAVRAWKCLLDATDTVLGTPECAVNFPRWLDMGESAGYDALPSAYLAQRQMEICRQRAEEFGEGSPEAVGELFFLTELERQRVDAHGGSKDYLISLLTLTLQRIPEGECQIAKLNCELYMAGIAKEQGNRELAEAYLRAAIDTRVKRGGAKPLLFQKLTKLEDWLTEWGEVAKVAELQPWKESVRASMNDATTV
ncbi:hypothetical protein KVR01_012383 [Diaporthe batatas]|uniref:uncharacterized protein n=1 Tax=Diaporthe batatas TaxID=748121 RepID=UPI001D0426B1|nr:uncharacterized protein KVR01_012383 [Diaporthe batatas]KAG8157721.1 hypothetical protein KVR01_012383 [Diaporthe batatas]